MEKPGKNELKITGTVQAFKANKHGDVDAVEIVNDTTTVKLNFPPHTAAAIMKAVKIGGDATVIYITEEKHGPKGDKKPKQKLQTIKSAGKGETVSVDSIKPPKHPEGKPGSFTFKNFELVTGKKGELVGIRENGKLVHIHKEDESIAEQIQKDSILEITACKRTDEGFVNEKGDEVYHPESITVSNSKPGKK